MIEDDENAPSESAVEVTLPDDDTKIVEVSLGNKAEIVEEQPKVVEKRATPEPEPQPVVDEREKALADLKKQYERQKLVAEAEREARKKAEEYARQQAQAAYSSQNDVQTSNLRFIQNAIESTEAAAANAERDYADAMAAGDYNAAAKAQRLMAKAEADLLQLNNGRSRLEEALQSTEGRVDGPQMPDFTPQVQHDPVEAYAQRLTPKSAQWLRSHPEAVDKIGKLTRAHQDAMEDGIVAESPEYFAYIEGRLGYNSSVAAPEPAPEPVRQATAPAKKNVASAPVSSNGSVMSPRSQGQGNVMTLTPSEVEVAMLMEPELPRDKAIESYARNKAALIKQGKLSA